MFMYMKQYVYALLLISIYDGINMLIVHKKIFIWQFLISKGLGKSQV